MILASCPAVGRTRTNAATGSPSAAGSTYPEAGDHPGLDQPLHPLGHRGRGHLDPTGQLGHADPGIGMQLGQQSPVDLVEHLR